MEKNKIVHGAAEKVRGANKLVLMYVGALAVTLIIVGVSLYLYKASGTAQLDLSRPGYEPAREPGTTTPPTANGFSATGPIDDNVIRQFNELFDETARQIRAVDAFKPEVLSDETLGIGE